MNIENQQDTIKEPLESPEKNKIGVGSSVVAIAGRFRNPFKGGAGFGGVVESISEDGLTAQVKFTVFSNESVQEYPISDLELK